MQLSKDAEDKSVVLAYIGTTLIDLPSREWHQCMTFLEQEKEGNRAKGMVVKEAIKASMDSWEQN